MNLLEVKNISKTYGTGEATVHALKNDTFSVPKGEFVAIMGASGSGKTTLLNCISTIDKVTSGHIFVGGEDITKLKGNNLNKFRREKLGFIFQDFNLLDTLTAYENISLALSIQNKSAKEIEKRVNDVATKLGIKDVLQKYPYQMSGGQKQRVASARAIITDPQIVLADEPTGNLDSRTSNDVLGLMKVTSQKFHQTLVMITHNNEIAQLADRIIRIEDGKISE